ncbi:MAG: transferrin receptor-like dimerization domain-containing protein [Gemmatimonadales bacterium]
MVPIPGGEGTVYDAWLKRQRGDTAQLTLGNLGGGSDFAGFYHHLGIPSAGIGFDGPYGVYHSMYDSYRWMTRFGDSAYRAHQAGARLVSVLLARLANADLLPLDYVGFGLEMTQLVVQLDSGITDKRLAVNTGPVREALVRFTESARRFERARAASLAGRADRRRWAAANAALMRVERALTRPQGLVSRAWYRSLQFASDVDNGYATMAFPTVNEAIRYGDAAAVEREIADLVTRIDAAREQLEAAIRALEA